MVPGSTAFNVSPRHPQFKTVFPRIEVFVVLSLSLGPVSQALDPGEILLAAAEIRRVQVKIDMNFEVSCAEATPRIFIAQFL